MLLVKGGGGMRVPKKGAVPVVTDSRSEEPTDGQETPSNHRPLPLRHGMS